MGLWRAGAAAQRARGALSRRGWTHPHGDTLRDRPGRRGACGGRGARAGGGRGLNGLRAALRIATLSLAALTLAACSSETTTLSGEAIVSDTPWPTSEEARYRLLDGDDEKGGGVLTIDSHGGRVTFRQA